MPERTKVQVWIHHARADGGLDVLLLRTNARRGSWWQPVTGAVEPGETLEQAAVREATEETGFALAAAPTPIGAPFQYHDQWGYDCTEHSFALEGPAGRPAPKLDPEEHDGFRWSEAGEAGPLLKFPSNAETLKALVAGRSRR
jgi:8-oxo-dGTP pyrophosphatase MutT (NUDIX family)